MIVHVDVVSEDRRFWKDGVGGSDTIVEPFRQVDNGHLLLYVPLDGLKGRGSAIYNPSDTRGENSSSAIP